MNNVLKISAIVFVVIIFVTAFIYLLDESLNTSRGLSQTEGSSSSYGILSVLNTLPDLDEQERIESLTGLNSIMYVFYLLLLVINLSFIWIIKQDESASKIIIYGFYTSITLVLFINFILLLDYNTWSLHHSYRITLNGVVAGFLASLFSICIHSVRNMFKILREESRSIIELLTGKIFSPNINTSLVVSKAWIIFTLLMSLFFIGLLLV